MNLGELKKRIQEHFRTGLVTLVGSGLARPDLVEAVYYPNAVHAFDGNVKDRTVAGSGGKTHHLAYDPVAAPDAEARTKAFFAKLLR